MGEYKVKSKSFLPYPIANFHFPEVMAMKRFWENVAFNTLFWIVNSWYSLYHPWLLLKMLSASDYFLCCILTLLKSWVSDPLDQPSTLLASQLLLQWPHCLDPSHSILILWHNWKSTLSSAWNLHLVESFISNFSRAVWKELFCLLLGTSVSHSAIFQNFNDLSFLKLLNLFFQLTARDNSSFQKKWG